MKNKKYFSIVVSLLIFSTFIVVKSSIESEIANQLANRLSKLDTNLKHVNVITSDAEKFSASFLKIIRGILKNIPSVITSSKGNLVSIKSQDYYGMVKILFIDLMLKRRNTWKFELTRKSRLLMNHTIETKPRSRCLIVITVKSSINSYVIRKFLKNLWKTKYLNVNLIEIHMASLKRSKKNKFLRQVINKQIRIYDYDPFKNKLHVQLGLSNLQSIFQNKLQDLHGYPLIVDTRFDYPRFRNKFNRKSLAWDFLGARTGINFAKYIVDSTNCSMIIQSWEGISRKKLRRSLAMDTLDIVASKRRSAIDETNSYAYTSYLLINNWHFVLAIRQFGYYENTMGYLGLILPLVSFFVIVTLFAFVKKPLRLDEKIASAYNATMIMLGQSSNSKLKRAVDRIIYLTLVYVSVSFTSDLIDRVFNLNFTQKKFYDFKTIENVMNVPFNLETGIPLVKYLEAKSEDNPVKRILQKINVMHKSITTRDECFAKMYDSSGVNFCHGKRKVVESLKILYEHYFRNGSSILTIVDEPLSLRLYFNYYILSRISPYLDKINDLIYKMMESGLYQFWDSEIYLQFYTKKNYAKKIKMPVYSVEETKSIVMSSLNKRNRKINASSQFSIVNDTTNMSIRLLCILLMGYFLSLVVFICENFTKKKN